MASHKSYLDYLLEQLSPLEDIAFRPMMGEYILYYRGKVIGGIYDDRFLVKPVQGVLDYAGSPTFAAPYPGAKEMLVVENIEDSAYVTGLVQAVEKGLPPPRKKRKG